MRCPAWFSGSAESISYEVFIGETIAVITILVVLGLQWLLTLLDAYMRRHRHLQQLTLAAYRETALLGLTAFILFLVELTSNFSDTITHQLDVIHICVWVIAILYIVWVATLVVFSARIGRRWARWEQHYPYESDALKNIRHHLENDYKDMRQLADKATKKVRSGTIAMIVTVLLHPIQALTYFRQLHILRYIELRSRFLARYGLPQDFPFWLYLNECKQYVFLKLAELPLILWCGVIYFVSLDLYLRTIWTWYDETIHAAVVIVIISAACIISSFVVWLKMRSVSWHILHGAYNMPESDQDLPAETAVPPVDPATIHHLTSFHRPPVHEIRRAMMESALASQKTSYEQRKLFWFGLPILLIRMLQGVLFGETAVVALFVISFSEVNDSVGSVLWSTLFMVFSGIISVVLLSAIVPTYVLTIHVSDLVDVQLLAQAVVRHEKMRRKKANEEIQRRRSAVQRERSAAQAAAIPTSWRTPVQKVLSSYPMQVVVSLAILMDFFLIALTTSTFLSEPLRIALLGIALLLVVFITIELVLRIWVVGCSTFFQRGDALLWNVLDVVLVIAAIAATTVASVFDIGPDPSGNAGAALYLAPFVAVRLLRTHLIVQLVREDGGGLAAPTEPDRVDAGSTIGSYTSFKEYPTMASPVPPRGVPGRSSHLGLPKEWMRKDSMEGVETKYVATPPRGRRGETKADHAASPDAWPVNDAEDAIGIVESPPAGPVSDDAIRSGSSFATHGYLFAHSGSHSTESSSPNSDEAGVSTLESFAAGRPAP